MSDLQFDIIYENISKAAQKIGKVPSQITLVAVSKKQSVLTIQNYIDYCAKRNLLCVLGENYLKEWKEKKELVTGTYCCHGIGHLQSNKIKEAVSLFDEIQSVDSEKTVLELEKVLSQKKERTAKFPVWIQINISDDTQKYGVPPQEGIGLAKKIKESELLSLSGLMTITKAYSQPEEARMDFRALRDLSDKMNEQIGFTTPLGLSMGMSSDFEVAIEEGATHIRVGSALFGARE